MKRARKVRHPLNPFRWVEPGVAWKAAVGLSLWLGSLVGVSHKAGVESASALDHASASVSVAVYAAEMADSLRVDVERLRRRIAVLEAAAGGDKLAEARESIARPQARKPATQRWWRFW